MTAEVSLVPVTDAEGQEFLQMAVQHFRSLNPEFVPQSDWIEHYFRNIQSNSNYALRWILADGRRAGFILFGVEKHRFLPRSTGNIYELYVCPSHRRRGIGLECARLAVAELQKLGSSKIQLEVMDGNEGARALWLSMGFRKVSERYVLPQAKP